MAKRKYSEVEMIRALKQMVARRSAAEVGWGIGGCSGSWKKRESLKVNPSLRRSNGLQQENPLLARRIKVIANHLLSRKATRRNC